MNTKSFQYYLFHLSAFILIYSLLLITKKNLFKSYHTLDQREDTLMKKPIDIPQKKDMIKNINLLTDNYSYYCNKDVNSLFSSRRFFSKNGILIDLKEEDVLLYFPVPNRWLLENRLDYTNPNILNEDPDHDGFSNLEEWQGEDPYHTPGINSSDPNDPNAHPLLWTKLRISSKALHTSHYSFDFMGVIERNHEDYFQLQPQIPIPHKNSQGKNSQDTVVTYVKLGECIGQLPIYVRSYHIKKNNYKEIDYDSSELVLQNCITNEQWTLTRNSVFHPQTEVLSIIDGVSFEYILYSPPKKIPVRCSHFFILEDLVTPQKTSDKKREHREIYQLIRISSSEAIITRNGKAYSRPISNEF